MPHFYFHHQERGGLSEDREGHECADLYAAEEYAFSVARRIIAREVINCGELCLVCSIEIHDEDDRFLLRVPFRRAVMLTGV